MVTQALAEQIADVLEVFQGTDTDASALLWFQSNNDVARLILAWPRVPVRLAGTSVRVPAPLLEKWQWLWRNYSYSTTAN